jgi:hypothetical protein
MTTKRIAAIIGTGLSFVVFVFILAACNEDRGMMHGNFSIGRDHWNWGQILISLSIGLIGGFLLGQVTARRK